jgi:hypothetical protein
VVAVDECAEVDHEEIAFDDAAAVGPVVGEAAVRTGGDDALEARPLGPQATHLGVEGQREGGLGGLVGQQREHVRERL